MIDAISAVGGSKESDLNTTKSTYDTGSQGAVANVRTVVTGTDASMGKGDNKDPNQQKENEKDPSLSTIEAAIDEVNQKLRMSKTRCEYSYDKPTKRVSIKVYDTESDKLIREVPPEKSLEILKRIWERAGIIVDEKR